MAQRLKLTALLSLALVASCRSPGRPLPHSERSDRPARGLAIVDVEMPELAWNTNVLRVKAENADRVRRTPEITVQYKNRSLPVSGIEWTTRHNLRPGRGSVIERDFMVRPLPGEVSVRVTVEDAGTQAVLYQEDLTAEFPLAYNRINTLQRTPLHKRGKRTYPTLRMAERGPFVFYTVEGDAFADAHLGELAARRERAYRSLVKQLNPDFEGRVAFFLFPDAKTKYAYTFHQGDGWAPGGRAIVEIFNARKELDPNHELVHVIAGPLGDPPAIFNEGLATHLQEQQRWEGYHVDAWAKAFMANKMLIPVSDLFAFSEIGPAESQPAIAYPQAGSFMGYMVDTFGMQKVLSCFRELESSDDSAVIQSNRRKFEEIIGRPLKDVEQSWRAALQRRDIKRVPGHIIFAIRIKTLFRGRP